MFMDERTDVDKDKPPALMIAYTPLSPANAEIIGSCLNRNKTNDMMYWQKPDGYNEDFKGSRNFTNHFMFPNPNPERFDICTLKYYRDKSLTTIKNLITMFLLQLDWATFWKNYFSPRSLPFIPFHFLDSWEGEFDEQWWLGKKYFLDELPFNAPLCFSFFNSRRPIG